MEESQKLEFPKVSRSKLQERHHEINQVGGNSFLSPELPKTHSQKGVYVSYAHQE